MLRLTESQLRGLILEEIRAIVNLEDVSGKTRRIVLTDEPTQNAKNIEAIKRFQSLYRSLDHETSYHLIKWLKKQLFKEFSIADGVAIASQVLAASKGNSEPKNPN